MQLAALRLQWRGLKPEGVSLCAQLGGDRDHADERVGGHLKELGVGGVCRVDRSSWRVSCGDEIGKLSFYADTRVSDPLGDSLSTFSHPVLLRLG